MLNEFPIIHTNIWDALWAIPADSSSCAPTEIVFQAPRKLVFRCRNGNRAFSVYFHQPSWLLGGRGFYGIFLRRCCDRNDLFNKSLVRCLSRRNDIHFNGQKPHCISPGTSFEKQHVVRTSVFKSAEGSRLFK